MEDSASERWCQASAINAEERSFLAQARVYQNMASLDTMETTAAARAIRPGTAMLSEAACRIFCSPPQPIPAPVANRMPASTMDATHSSRSWP